MSPFEVIPAIDLLDGRCVNLVQGDYDQVTVFGDDPVEVAKRFAEHPLRRLHVVDLDGAKAGAPRNDEPLRGILAAVGDVPVQIGGGIRRLEDCASRLELGIERVILGTVALRDPALVKEAAAKFPGRVAVGIDGRGGRVAVEGWTEQSETTVAELAHRFEDAGVAALVYTDIGRDGMMEGPDFERTAALAEALSIPVIASGGVSSDADLEQLLELHPRGVAGAIVGRAVYTGAVELGAALQRAEAACS